MKQQLCLEEVNSVSQLRKICHKYERITRERPHQLPAARLSFPRHVEVDVLPRVLELGEDDAVNEISNRKRICWSCRQEDHFMDSEEERSIFCYGFGAPNICKQKCAHCNPAGNLTVSRDWNACLRLTRLSYLN